MDASNHTWSSVVTQQRFDSEMNGSVENTYHQITYQCSTFSTSQLKWSTIVKECYTIIMLLHKMAFYLQDAEVILMSDHAPLEKLIKNQTKNTLTQNWALEIFSITPYITFKHIKDKESILADSLTQLQRLDLYEKCPCKENEQDQLIMIFDKVEPIKVMADPKAFMPPDLNMFHMVTGNANSNASQYLNKDTFVLHDITYIIDDEPLTKHQINLSTTTD